MILTFFSVDLEMLSDDDYVFVMDEDIGKKMYSNWLEAIKVGLHCVYSLLLLN